MQSLTADASDDGSDDGTGNPTDGGTDEDTGSAQNTLLLLSPLGVANTPVPEFFIGYRHNFPVIPHFKARHAQLQYEELSTSGIDITFAGETFTAGTELLTNIDLTKQDIQLYYPVLNSWLQFDVGADIINFTYEVELTGAAETTTPDDGTGGESSTAVSATARANAQHIAIFTQYGFQFPESKLSFAGDISYLKDGDTVIREVDHHLKLTWETRSGEFDSKLGYRSWQYAHNFDELALDLKSTGYYLALSYSF